MLEIWINHRGGQAVSLRFCQQGCVGRSARCVRCHSVKRQRISKWRISRQASYQIRNRLIGEDCITRSQYGLSRAEYVKREPYTGLKIHIILVVRQAHRFQKGLTTAEDKV